MVVIVGAGPAGLATAYELQRRGVPYRILERNAIGHTWSNQYDRLHLHTLKQVSALPGLPMPASYTRFPSAHAFHAYLRAYAQHFKLNITCGVEVKDARWSDGSWRLQTNHCVVAATTLVVAAGIWSTPVRPMFAGQEQFGGAIIHSKAYHNAAPFAGQRVLVVGAGNSGSEIAVDLSEHDVTTSIAIRGGVTFVPFPTSPTAMRIGAWMFRHLPRPLGEALLRHVRRDYTEIGIPPPLQPLLDSYPVVGYQLPQAVATGKIVRYGGIARFVPRGVQFTDGQYAEFDSVIMAIGYRPTVQFVARDIELDTRGRPRVDAHWRSLCNPHLFCVGFDYPTTAGWLQAIGRVARQAAEGIAATTAASPKSFSASTT